MKIVQKYGGSSLADPECVQRVVARILQDAQGNKMLVVVSAQGKTTDAMTKTYRNYSSCFPSRESDAMLVCGEQMSAALLTAAIQKTGQNAISLNGAQVPIYANGEYGDGRIARIITSTIQQHWSEGRIVVVTGFQGVNKKGELITLGRGGSDTSAVALAAALKADRCQIFTDVDGVYSADPGKISTAVRFDAMHQKTMLDLALGGAKVLHPRAAQLAIQYNVPLEILSSFSRTPGTSLSKIAPRQRGITLQNHEGDYAEITATLPAEDCTKTILNIIKEVYDVAISFRYGGHKLTLTLPSSRSEEYLRRLHDVFCLTP